MGIAAASRHRYGGIASHAWQIGRQKALSVAVCMFRHRDGVEVGVFSRIERKWAGTRIAARRSLSACAHSLHTSCHARRVRFLSSSHTCCLCAFARAPRATCAHFIYFIASRLLAAWRRHVDGHRALSRLLAPAQTSRMWCHLWTTPNRAFQVTSRKQRAWHSTNISIACGRRHNQHDVTSRVCGGRSAKTNRRGTKKKKKMA